MLILFQTVLETPPVQNEDETDVWSHGFLVPSDVNDTPKR